MTQQTTYALIADIDVQASDALLTSDLFRVDCMEECVLVCRALDYATSTDEHARQTAIAMSVQFPADVFLLITQTADVDTVMYLSAGNVLTADEHAAIKMRLFDNRFLAVSRAVSDAIAARLPAASAADEQAVTYEYSLLVDDVLVPASAALNASAEFVADYEDGETRVYALLHNEECTDEHAHMIAAAVSARFPQDTFCLFRETSAIFVDANVTEEYYRAGMIVPQ